MATEIEKLLRYESKAHTDVSEKLRKRLKLSQDRFSNAHSQMALNEEQFRAFIPEREADKVRKASRKQGLPQFTTIEIPYSYAQILATHTYITSVFLSRDPVLQYAGRHGESQQQEQCVEALMAYQMQQAMVQMYIWLLDPGKYGYGIVGHYWCEEMVRVKEKVQVPATFLGVEIPGKEPKTEWKVKEIPGYVGNKLYNVRPQDFLSDPRVPLSQFQRGEFCARYVELTWSELHAGRKQGKYFNLDKLRTVAQSSESNTGDIQRDTGSAHVSNLPNDNGVEDPLSGGLKGDESFIVKGYEIYVRLIPSRWNLGKENQEEIWIFTRANSGLIIGAQPLPNWHGKFGFDIIEDEVDGYNLFSKSSLEMMKPLNDVMSWLVNTHFYNVRAALNNQFVIDPSMLVMKDVENPNPGKLLRLKPEAYGRDVRTTISQLPVADVTRGHLNDMSVVADMIQRATGVNDNIMGMMNQGGRKTATETRSSSTFGVNRLKTKAEYYSAMGFSPMAQKMLQNSQQFYSLERKYRLVGDLAQQAPQFAMITPESIAGFFDFVPVDGTMPIDRFAQANLWGTLLGQMRNFPQIMASYDIAKIFGFVAGLGGLKNVSQFRVQTVPDAQLQNQAQAGNSIPVSQPGNLNEPGQIPGMGATG